MPRCARITAGISVAVNRRWIGPGGVQADAYKRIETVATEV
jgi:hypothetical protein